MKAKRLPSGNYRVQVFEGYDEKGKRIIKSFTADTELEAIRLAVEYKINQGNVPDILDLTLKSAFDAYINSRKNIIEKTTLRGYHQVRDYRFQSIMSVKIKDLKSIDVQNAVNAECGQVSPKTIKNAYGLLKSVLKMFKINIDYDRIVLPKMQKKDRQLPDFKTLYDIIKGTEIELPCLLSAWLSLRIGEVIGLQFRDVDEKKRTIKVRRTIIRTETGFEVREGCKTEKSKRELELPEHILSMIKAVPHKRETDFIIPLSRKAVYSRFKRLTRNHGIEMTYHDLRHLNASIMLMLGIPDKYAMERGGWSTDHILKSVYQQTFTDERNRIDGVIDDYFNSIVE